ncbi:hypothetical protein M3Y97_00185300 [Aphelenchoides bicaudatus]|nr:hypothetical protein M3Y97_00185300 [Aphelenchoides bicaudatus]
MPKEKKERDHEDSYFYHGGFHVHRLVVAITMIGCLFNVFPLIYMTTRQHSHFDVARVSTAVISLVCYLLLYWGNTKQVRLLYFPYLVINSSLLIIWLVCSIVGIYFSGVIIDRLLHPEARENQLNIWWIVYVAAYMTNNPDDYNRPGTQVPIAIQLISASLLALFGTLFQFYFLWIVYKAYRYLDSVLLNPDNSKNRRIE